MEHFLEFLRKDLFNLFIFGVALVSGGMLIWPLFSRIGRTAREVGPLEAVQLINRRDALVIDIRETGEYAGGHIVGSRHIPAGQLSERMKEVEKFKKRPAIVVCRTGARASGPAEALRKQGFGEVLVLKGGIAAWQQAGMPLEK